MGFHGVDLLCFSVKIGILTIVAFDAGAGIFFCGRCVAYFLE